MKLEFEQIAKIPFIDLAELPGRTLFSTVFYDGEWHAWIEAGDQLLATRMWPAEAMYFGTQPQQTTDICLHFLNVIGQRLNYLPVAPLLFGLQDDVFNLSASLAKIQLLHRTRKDHKSGASRMVATEIEYLHGVCRSIFDLLQEVVVVLWDNIMLLDQNVKKRQLKKSYREMLFSGNKLQSSEEIVKRFPGLPQPLADCYVRSAVFFADLRKFRDRIVHQGAGVDIIFDGEDDFYISEARVPFSEMKVWQDKDRQPNALVPLMPALGFVIYRTLETCDDFSRTIERIFQLPPALVPNFHILLRGYFNEELVQALNDIHRRLVPQARANAPL
ncbi:MAG: hypothetical protein ACLQB4_14430 [Beijerinckiaceae bacterium]